MGGLQKETGEPQGKGRSDTLLLPPLFTLSPSLFFPCSVPPLFLLSSSFSSPLYNEEEDDDDDEQREPIPNHVAIFLLQ
jgi:hypothetical protein